MKDAWQAFITTIIVYRIHESVQNVPFHGPLKIQISIKPSVKRYKVQSDIASTF